MSDHNQDPTERFLQKTIKLKKRTLKPYEKKCVKKNEFRYDVPIQPSIPQGQPTVCYNRINTRQTDHQGQPTLNVRSELAEPARETLSSRQDVDNSYGTSEPGPSEGNKNGTFLSPVESYVQSLKLDKGISIFPGVNGPGNVLVAKDFSLEKQKLQKDKWILIERKPVSFENDQFCWVHWCSCNAVTSRQVSLLDSYINTSEEDFFEQYPDCLHLRASRKLFEKYDLDNSIVPTPDMNCRSEQEQDHDTYQTRNMIYEIPDTNILCCYSEELKRFGLVEWKNHRFSCLTCKKLNCQHSHLMTRLKQSGNFEDYINIRNFIEELTEEHEQSKGYKPKLLSYKRIPYNLTDELAESLHQLKNIKRNVSELTPEDTVCRHCGNELESADPIENGWVAYESVPIITNTDISYAKAYYRPCTFCDSISFFEGQSICLLNCGRYLVGYDVLLRYMHGFLHGRSPLHTFYERFCDLHINYRNSAIRDVFSYQHLRHAWLHFLSLLDIDFTDGFLCPECGGDDGAAPSMLICDGTSLSFQRRMWQWDDLKDEPVKQLNRSSFHEKIFIPDFNTRKLLHRLAAGGQYIRGKTVKPLDKKEKEKLFKDIKEASLPLSNLLTEIECDPGSIAAYRKLLLSLASPSPVCSYVHPTTEVQDLLSEIFKEIDVRKNPILVEKIHKLIPIIFDVLENKSIAGSLKLLLKEMWNIAIDPFVDSIPDQESEEEIKNEEMAFFPSLPKIRNRGVFDQDKRNTRNNRKLETCSKTYRGHPSLLPGIFTIFCPHGVCYGFQVMQTNESPDVPFTIFRTRFKTAPKYIIYDNACKLHSYCISRDPQFFKDTEFYVDRLHWENHTSCSYGYNLSLYPQFNSINSQLSEQSNAGLKRIKDQLSYMTANNFLSHCTFYLWNKNMDKLSTC